MKCADCGEDRGVSDSETMCQDCADVATFMAAKTAALRVSLHKQTGHRVAATNLLLNEVADYARMAAAA